MSDPVTTNAAATPGAPSEDGVGGSWRGLVLASIRILGIALLALALVAASLFAIQLSLEIRRDPDLSARILLPLGAVAVAIASFAAVGVLELARRGRTDLAVAISLITLVAGRAIVIVALPTPLRTDWLDYHNLAVALSHGNAIDSARPIGWPAVLGVVYAIGGPKPVLGELFNLGCMLVTGLLLYWLAKRAFGPTTGAAATFLYAISPAPVIFVSMLASEPLFTALLMTAAALAVLGLEGRWRAWVAGGLTLGVGQYVRPAALILLPGFLALPVLTVIPLRRAIVAAVLGAGLFVLPLVPNVASQYEQTGRLTLSTSNYDGLNLLVGLNERSGGAYNREDRASLGDAPESSRAFIDVAYRLAFERLRADPLVVARLAPTKFQRMWGDATYAARFAIADSKPADPGRALLSLVSQGMHVLIIGLGVVGLLAHRSTPRVVVLAVLCLGMASLAALFLETQPRYHAPFEPFLCLLGGIGLAALWERVIRARGRSRTPAETWISHTP